MHSKVKTSIVSPQQCLHFSLSPISKTKVCGIVVEWNFNFHCIYLSSSIFNVVSFISVKRKMSFLAVV